MMEKLRKWTQHSDFTAVLEIRAELGKTRMKRNDDLEVLSSPLSAIRNKDKGNRVSVDTTKLAESLIATASKDYLSSINTGKGHLEQNMLPVTVNKIVNNRSDLFQMQKVRNIKLKNDDKGDG